MPLVVQKYGGTSVATDERIMNVAQRVVKTKQQGKDVVVVVSAQAGVTDLLVKKAHSISTKPQGRDLDLILATGEQISIALLSLAIKELGEDAIALTAMQAGIVTCASYNRAQIKNINTERVNQGLQSNKIVIVAGFQGVTESNEITTLGRGGSDITAVAIGVALKANAVYIYTDVNGLYTADPRLVENASKIELISYNEMLEMAGSGAKVLHSRSVELAARHNIPLIIASSFNKQIGTRVQEESDEMEKSVVRGLAHDLNIAKIAICNIPDYHHTVVSILSEVAKANININLFTESYIDEHNNNLTLLIPDTEYQRIVRLLEPRYSKYLKSSKDIARISVIGIGLKTTAGIASKVVNTLTKAGIKIDLVSCSEINISCLIPESSYQEALILLHQAFEL